MPYLYIYGRIENYVRLLNKLIKCWNPMYCKSIFAINGNVENEIPHIHTSWTYCMVRKLILSMSVDNDKTYDE